MSKQVPNIEHLNYQIREVGKTISSYLNLKYNNLTFSLLLTFNIVPKFNIYGPLH